MKTRNLISIKNLLAALVLAYGGFFAGESRAQNLKYVCPDFNKEPCVTAKKMISASQMITLGEESKGDDWIYIAEGMLSGHCSDKAYEQKIKDGLKLSDATNYWKCYLASGFTGDGTRLKVIKRAYLKVYGAFPIIAENNYWIEQMKQKKAWYTQIIFTEQGKLYKDTNLHKKVIDHVYRDTMNRGADQKDLDYWLARDSDFEQMYVAARNFLYSNAGAKDLHDTVKRAYWVMNQKYPTEQEITAWTEKFKPGRKIYLEMVGKETGYDF